MLGDVEEKFCLGKAKLLCLRDQKTEVEGAERMDTSTGTLDPGLTS